LEEKMKKEDKLLMRNNDESIIRRIGHKNNIKLDIATVENALNMMPSICGYKIRKNATFINKVVI